MTVDREDPELTAYALGEMSEADRSRFEAKLEETPEAEEWIREIRETAALLENALASEPAPRLDDRERATLVARADAPPTSRVKRFGRRWQVAVGIAASMVIAFSVMIYTPRGLPSPEVSLPVPPARPATGLVGLEPPDKGPTGPPQTRQEPAKDRLRSLGYVGVEGDQEPVSESITVSGESPAISAGLQGQAGQEPGYYAYSPLPINDFARGDIDRHRKPSDFNTESYSRIDDNPFRRVSDESLSTFSIDVDTASYANVRRFLTRGARPPRDAVRIEEMINYFTYDYAAPRGAEPFSVNVDLAEAPWRREHRLVRIGLKGRQEENRPASNLVFLLDVSGSMNEPSKLPLVKESMKLLVEQLRENDRVAIVVYAGASGLVLPSTSSHRREAIFTALNELRAGGSTNGGQGIELAYRIASENFVKSGTNRVILATDGDFNVGVTNEGALTRLIEEKAKGGVFLTVLGFGMGNLKDSTMEKLADRGNGNYAYIDSLSEARKVLVRELGGTLVTIAKDVKIQVEFNPAEVGAFRLLGYENRILQHQDFNDDTKDAGEIGAGHTVTALYEIVPLGKENDLPGVDALKYQKPAARAEAASNGELMTVKLRYKEPTGDKSELLSYPVKDRDVRLSEASEDFKFAASVAAFGMILRDSPHKGDASFSLVEELAREGRGKDTDGYRAEFLDLVRKARQVEPR